MTGKTLKHELYKHGSYLHSLKEVGSEFVNIDEEIKKLEELFQLASKKDTPLFAVGEYYADKFFVYKILEIAKTEEVGVWDAKLNALELSTGKIIENTKWFINEKSGDKPATAEQIAMFHRAEQFAAKGRKWSEFKKGDKVLNNNTGRIGIVESVDEDGDAVVNYNSEGPLSIRDYKCTGALYLDIIQTAEELQEVADAD